MGPTIGGVLAVDEAEIGLAVVLCVSQGEFQLGQLHVDRLVQRTLVTYLRQQQVLEPIDAAKGLAIVAMEPLRGGTLVNGLPPAARKVLEQADPEKTAVGWAFEWLWKHPEVRVVLSGMSHLDHVKENLHLAENLKQKEWKKEDQEAIQSAVRIIRAQQMVDCTACNYCMPCPEGVNIPRNFALYNDHHMLKDPAAKLRYQRLLSDMAKASNCIQCGLCEPQCPQSIPIRAELKHVDELLSN